MAGWCLIGFDAADGDDKFVDLFVDLVDVVVDLVVGCQAKKS